MSKASGWLPRGRLPRGRLPGGGLRFRLLTLAVLGTAVLLMAPWYWNASWIVEGTEFHTAWSIDGVEDLSDYDADIRLKVPKGADVTLQSSTPNERVKVSHTGGLSCDDDSVEVLVDYRIEGDGGADGDVTVRLFIVTEGDGEVDLVTATGSLGEKIRVSTDILADSPSCYEGDDDDDDHDDDDDDEDEDDDHDDDD